jgi:hypothetical protein
VDGRWAAADIEDAGLARRISKRPVAPACSLPLVRCQISSSVAAGALLDTMRIVGGSEMMRYLGGVLGLVATVALSLLLEAQAQACVYPYSC